MGFSAVVKALVGETSGPSSWRGPIGELMDGATELPFNARFQKVNHGPELPQMDESLLRALSHDQHVAFRYFRMVKSGL